MRAACPSENAAHFLVAWVAEHNDGVTFVTQLARPLLSTRDNRAGRVDHFDTALLELVDHGRSHSVGSDRNRPVTRGVQARHDCYSLFAETVSDERVMNDGAVGRDWATIGDGLLHHVHGPPDSVTEAHVA